MQGAPSSGAPAAPYGPPSIDPTSVKWDAPAPQPFNVLPFSEDAAGKVHFDPTAGLLGSIWRAYNAPGDAAEGKFDPLSKEGIQRAMETASLIAPTGVATRAEGLAVPGLATFASKVPEAPSLDALKAAAKSDYTAARATGATYPGQAVGAVAQQTIDGLNNDGFLSILAPKTHQILGDLAKPPAGSTVTISSLDAARKALGKIGPENPADMAAARRGIDGIDGFIQSGGAGSAPPVQPSVLAGTTPALPPSAANVPGANGAAAPLSPQAQAAQLITNARGNSAAAFRSARIQGLEENAENRAAAANSGQNLGNTLRQRLASLLNSDKQSRGFSPEELDATKRVVQGTPVSNALRYSGNMLGGGGGLGHTLIGGLGAGLGGYFGGEAGAAAGAVTLPMLGHGLREAYNKSVSNQLSALDNMIRMRSPLYQTTLAGAPPVGPNLLFQGPPIRAGLLAAQPAQ